MLIHPIIIITMKHVVIILKPPVAGAPWIIVIAVSRIRLNVTLMEATLTGSVQIAIYVVSYPLAMISKILIC